MENQNPENASNDAPKGNCCTMCPSFDLQFIISRVKEVLTNPKGCWDKIGEETLSIKDIYLRFVVFLAAIPALCGFIKGSIIGIHVFGMSVRVSFFAGLVHAIVWFLLFLLFPYIFAFAFEKLAPMFGGELPLIKGFKIAAYSTSIFWVAGIFYLLPIVTLIILVAAAIYAVYLSYEGVKKFASVPADKRVPYYIATVVASLVCFVIIWGVVFFFLPNGAVSSAGLPANININLDQFPK
jgi:hypothetical protein